MYYLVPPLWYTGLMCFSDWNTLYRPNDRTPNVGELWSQPGLLWQKMEIKVKFMNRIPAWQNEDGDWINATDILPIANQWHACGPSVVPKFVKYDNGPSDIRVEFNGKVYMLCTRWNAHPQAL